MKIIFLQVLSKLFLAQNNLSCFTGIGCSVLRRGYITKNEIIKYFQWHVPEFQITTMVMKTFCYTTYYNFSSDVIYFLKIGSVYQTSNPKCQRKWAAKNSNNSPTMLTIIQTPPWATEAYSPFNSHSRSKGWVPYRLRGPARGYRTDNWWRRNLNSCSLTLLSVPI